MIEGEFLGSIQANLQKLSLLIGLEPLEAFGSPSPRDRVKYGGVGGGSNPDPYICLHIKYEPSPRPRTLSKVGRVGSRDYIRRFQRLYGGQKAL